MKLRYNLSNSSSFKFVKSSQVCQVITPLIFYTVRLRTPCRLLFCDSSMRPVVQALESFPVSGASWSSVLSSFLVRGRVTTSRCAVAEKAYDFSMKPENFVQPMGKKSWNIWRGFFFQNDVLHVDLGFELAEYYRTHVLLTESSILMYLYLKPSKQKIAQHLVYCVLLAFWQVHLQITHCEAYES